MKLKNTSDVAFVVSPLTGNEAELLEMVDISKIITSYNSNFSIDISGLCKGHTSIGLYECHDSGLKFYYPMIAGDDRFYEEFQKYPWYYQDEKSEWQYAKEYTRDKRIVEIGCGEGKFSAYAEASEYVGLELNGNAVKVAKEKGLDVREQLSSAHVAERSDYYDVVCSFQVLEHVVDINGFVSDAVKLCRPGGKIILSVPSEDGFVGLASNNTLNMPPHHVSRWTDKALEFLPSIHEMKLLELHKDEFDMIHYEWYARTMGSVVFRALLNKNKVPLISSSITDRLIEKVGRIIGRKMIAGGSLSNILPSGHSVTAVYEK